MNNKENSESSQPNTVAEAESIKSHRPTYDLVSDLYSRCLSIGNSFKSKSSNTSKLEEKPKDSIDYTSKPAMQCSKSKELIQICNPKGLNDPKSFVSSLESGHKSTEVCSLPERKPLQNLQGNADNKTRSSAVPQSPTISELVAHLPVCLSFNPYPSNRQNVQVDDKQVRKLKIWKDSGENQCPSSITSPPPKKPEYGEKNEGFEPSEYNPCRVLWGNNKGDEKTEHSILPVPSSPQSPMISQLVGSLNLEINPRFSAKHDEINVQGNRVRTLKISQSSSSSENQAPSTSSMTLPFDRTESVEKFKPTEAGTRSSADKNTWKILWGNSIGSKMQVKQDNEGDEVRNIEPDENKEVKPFILWRF